MVEVATDLILTHSSRVLKFKGLRLARNVAGMRRKEMHTGFRWGTSWRQFICKINRVVSDNIKMAYIYIYSHVFMARGNQ
jgi:hypothetical protein